MPRRGEVKARTHQRIVVSAGKLIRQKGLGGATVPQVMRGAGLTIGGFYAHFRSKRAMDAEVLKKTLADMHSRWLSNLEGSDAAGWLARAVKRYLSPAHRDAPQDGCAFPAVMSEAVRADRRTRAVLREAFETYAKELAEHAPEVNGVAPRERALATLALCIGGLAIARAFKGEPISDEVLRACRKWAVLDCERAGAVRQP